MNHLHKKLPLVINKSDHEVADHVEQIKQSDLDAETQNFATGCIELALQLPQALQEKTATIRQLQRLVFGDASSGKKNKKKRKKMGKMARFHFHRQHSKPIMLCLHKWLKQQLSDKLVEPNNPMGKAIKYMLRHWKKLRRFLVVPGAPIDNNLVERALTIPIRVRKTANFYKTEHGAAVASILTSLAHTAILSNVNPIEYFIALQENKSKVFQDASAWLPWNYQETLDLHSLKAA